MTVTDRINALVTRAAAAEKRLTALESWRTLRGDVKDRAVDKAITDLQAETKELRRLITLAQPIGVPLTSPEQIISVSPGVTAATLETHLANMNYDAIEFAAGTYTGLHVFIRQARARRPMVMRPARNAAVIFDNTGGAAAGYGLFYFGANVGDPGVPSEPTTYISVEGKANGGSMRIQNYDIGGTGLMYTGWVDHITLNDIVCRDIIGVLGGSTSHCLYVSSDDVNYAKNIVANRWDVGPFVGRKVNAYQSYHNPNGQGITLHNWIVTGCHRAAYLWSNATGLDLNGWTISDCDATIDAQETAVGTVRNCTATTSGPTVPGSGYWLDTNIVDAGGNSW